MTLTKIIMCGVSSGDHSVGIPGCEATLTLDTEYELDKKDIFEEKRLMVRYLKEHLDDDRAQVMTQEEWEQHEKEYNEVLDNEN